MSPAPAGIQCAGAMCLADRELDAVFRKWTPAELAALIRPR
jgi:hypothetical protein